LKRICMDECIRTNTKSDISPEIKFDLEDGIYFDMTWTMWYSITHLLINAAFSETWLLEIIALVSIEEMQ